MKRHASNIQALHAFSRPAPRARPKWVGLVRCLVLGCMIFTSGAVFAADPLTLDIAIKSIDSSRPPRMVDDVLILGYKPDRPARFVGARFAHEAWKVLHPYSMNDRGVFVLDYQVPEGVQEIRYRIVVDGLWMADPANPRTDTDAAGVSFSMYALEKEPFRTIVNPKQVGDELVFVFHGSPGRRVSLVGDFNNWDPFMDPLDEMSPGTYSVSLRVPPGRHWYSFFSDGRRILDRFNAQTGVDPDGHTVSSFASPS
jgi:1,4-alpha-glucan branching enzyme